MAQRKKLLCLKGAAETLEEWSEKSGVSQSEIITQMIVKQDSEIPDFLKKKERKAGFSAKYEESRQDKGKRLYLKEFAEPLKKYEEITGESQSFLVRKLLEGAIKSAPHLFGQ